jgi:hypothetical protein
MLQVGKAGHFCDQESNILVRPFGGVPKTLKIKNLLNNYLRKKSKIHSTIVCVFNNES